MNRLTSQELLVFGFTQRSKRYILNRIEQFDIHAWQVPEQVSSWVTRIFRKGLSHDL